MKPKYGEVYRVDDKYDVMHVSPNMSRLIPEGDAIHVLLLTDAGFGSTCEVANLRISLHEWELLHEA